MVWTMPVKIILLFIALRYTTLYAPYQMTTVLSRSLLRLRIYFVFRDKTYRSKWNLLRYFAPTESSVKQTNGQMSSGKTTAVANHICSFCICICRLPSFPSLQLPSLARYRSIERKPKAKEKKPKWKQNERKKNNSNFKKKWQCSSRKMSCDQWSSKWIRMKSNSIWSIWSIMTDARHHVFTLDSIQPKHVYFHFFITITAMTFYFHSSHRTQRCNQLAERTAPRNVCEKSSYVICFFFLVMWP